jgi:hypothetical protein
MSDFLDFLFSEAPWLKPVLVEGVALLLACIILTPIAYFIVWPFLLRVRQQVAALIAALTERFEKGRDARKERLDKEADEFKADGGLWRIKFKAPDQRPAEFRHVSQVLQGLGKSIAEAANALNSANRRVPELVRTLESAKVEAVQPLPALPSAGAVAESSAGYRIAWLKLVLSGLILAAIMTVNTAMLSQILRDLGIVPPALVFFGVPVAYFLAFLMTGVEAGLGVAHAATRIPNKFAVWPYFFGVLAFGVSLVEGFFWSRIAPPLGTFTLPFVGYEMLQPSLFYCFGFVLVWTLFGLGSVGFESAASVLGGRQSDLLSRAIDKLRGLHEQYARSVSDTAKPLADAVSAANEIDKKIQGPAANAENVLKSVEKLRQEIEERSKLAPDSARGVELELTRPEVYQLAQMGGLWLTLTLIGATAMTVIGLEGFSDSMDPKLRWALAIGQAVAFFGIGALLGSGEMIVRRGYGENERDVIVAPALSRWMAYGIGCVLVVFYLALAFTTIRGAEWMVNLILGLFLIAAGYHLTPLLNVVRLWLRRTWNLAVLIVQALWLAFMQVLRFIVVVLESVAHIFAAPLDVIRSQRGPKPPTPAPSAVAAKAGT